MILSTRTLLAIAVSAASLPALAATTTYTDSASFLANVSAGAYFNDFNTGVFTNPASYSASGSGFGYTVTANAGSQVYLSGEFIGTFSANQVLTVTFTSGNPTAVGGDFFVTDSFDGFLALPVTVTLSDGTTSTFTPAGVSNGFRGFTSTVAIASLTMAAPGASNFNSFDNFTVGLANPVPEPASWALMAMGLVGVSLLRRRRAN